MSKRSQRCSRRCADLRGEIPPRRRGTTGRIGDIERVHRHLDGSDDAEHHMRVHMSHMADAKETIRLGRIKPAKPQRHAERHPRISAQPVAQPRRIGRLKFECRHRM